MFTALTRLSLVALLLTALLALVACKSEEPKTEPPAEEPPATQPADAPTTEPVSADNADKIILVSGMDCAGCEGAVNKAVAALPGVEGVYACHASGKAYIKLAADASVTDEQLIAAINAMPGDSIKASAAN